VRWSLSELEDIVYEFIHCDVLPAEFRSPEMMAGKDSKLGKDEPDVLREDLMKVRRIHSHASDLSIDTSQRDNDNKSGDGLPQLVRDYILHDRGNSLYLGDSFANLPSPVAENATIKRLFKFKEDEDEMNKPRHAKNES
jgi:hypothetical protein